MGDLELSPVGKTLHVAIPEVLNLVRVHDGLPPMAVTFRASTASNPNRHLVQIASDRRRKDAIFANIFLPQTGISKLSLIFLEDRLDFGKPHDSPAASILIVAEALQIISSGLRIKLISQQLYYTICITHTLRPTIRPTRFLAKSRMPFFYGYSL